MEISTVIAIFSLLVAATALVLNHLSPAKITTFIGPVATFGYPNEGGFSLNLPVTFSNHGSKTGSIFRVAAAICHRESPHERYFMQWDSFLKLEFRPAQWVHDELAHALVIAGKSILAKNILFVWYPTSQPPITIREGLYDLVLLFWTSDMTVPRIETHQIRILTPALETLKDTDDPAKPRSVNVQLDQQLEPNKFMSEFDWEAVKKLTLKKPD